MCDAECRRRFTHIELMVAALSTDIVWLKRLTWLVLAALCANVCVDATVL